jgi:uncharacterized membrane protein YoaK (UPF0700 family)
VFTPHQDVEMPMIPPRYVPAAVPALLSFVAGYIDSCTFLALFGLFVAQVTGSFVLTSAEFVTHDPAVGVGVKVVGIPAFFLAGVATTVMVRSAERRGQDALPAALALEAVLLTGLLVSWLAGRPLPKPNALADLSAGVSGIFAMGVQSALVRLLVQGSPSTSVMTTNTTQLAIDTTEFVLAWWRRGGVPADTKAAGEYVEIKRRLNKLWPIMLGFLLGTLAGAVAYIRLDLWCVVLAIAIVGTLSAATHLCAASSKHSGIGQRQPR